MVKKNYKPIQRVQQASEVYDNKKIGIFSNLNLRKDEYGMEDLESYWEAANSILRHNKVESLDNKKRSNNNKIDTLDNLFLESNILPTPSTDNIKENSNNIEELPIDLNTHFNSLNDSNMIDNDMLDSNSNMMDNDILDNDILDSNILDNDILDNGSSELMQFKHKLNNSETRAFYEDGEIINISKDKQIISDDDDKDKQIISDDDKVVKSINKEMDKFKCFAENNKIGLSFMHLNYNSQLLEETVEHSKIFHVLSGKLSVKVNDSKKFIVKRNQIFSLEENTQYQMKSISIGGTKLLMNYSK